MFLSSFFPQVLFVLVIYVRESFCQDDRVIFPDDPDTNSVHGARIPEKLLIEMKDVHNVSEFVARFVPDYEGPEVDTFGIVGRRQFSPPMFSIAEFAVCRPELEVVELDKPESGDILLWPQCIRLLRCGGCCTSNLLACRPVATSFVNITVLQVRYNPTSGEAFESDGLRVMTLEQHDHCVCECRERAEDCTDVQLYRADECRCICANQDQAVNCTGSRKIWDPEDCLCKCRRTELCSTGRFFNPLTCRCELARRSRTSPINTPAVTNFTTTSPINSTTRSLINNTTSNTEQPSS